MTHAKTHLRLLKADIVLWDFKYPLKSYFCSTEMLLGIPRKASTNNPKLFASEHKNC